MTLKGFKLVLKSVTLLDDDYSKLLWKINGFTDVSIADNDEDHNT